MRLINLSAHRPVRYRAFIVTRKNTAITLSLKPHQRQCLEELAIALGIYWGAQPNISGLIQAIGDRRLLVIDPGSPVPEAKYQFYEQQIADMETAIANLKSLVE